MYLSVFYLLGLAFVAWFVSTVFVLPTPPGGVAWPYYVVLLMIPYATYRLAKRLSIATSYGFACGVIFAWPVFVDSRTGLALEFGSESEGGLLAKILLFATGMTVVCITVYGVGWRQSHRQDAPRTQFSLRELLVAMTIIAVFLSIAISMIRLTSR